MLRIVMGADIGTDPMVAIEMLGSLDDIDRALIPEWVAMLREAETNVRHLRQRLESLGSERACPVCGGVVTGRADRRYCSTVCRVSAHRTGV